MTDVPGVFNDPKSRRVALLALAAVSALSFTNGVVSRSGVLSGGRGSTTQTVAPGAQLASAPAPAASYEIVLEVPAPTPRVQRTAEVQPVAHPQTEPLAIAPTAEGVDAAAVIDAPPPEPVAEPAPAAPDSPATG